MKFYDPQTDTAYCTLALWLMRNQAEISPNLWLEFNRVHTKLTLENNLALQELDNDAK